MLMTPHQIRAVETTNRSVALVACAGSGKTRVLVERFRHLVEKLQVPIYRILLFTFTEKAASEIKERILKEEIIKPIDEALLSVGTIHSFLFSLLRRYGTRIGIDPNFTIKSEFNEEMDRENLCRHFLMEKIKNSDPVSSFWIDRYGFSKISRLIISLLKEPRIYLSNQEEPESVGDKNHNSTQSLKTLARELHKIEIHNKLKQKILHFDDLEYLALRLLRTNPDIRQKLVERYNHLLVDEFQDTSPIQGTLIKTLHEAQKNILFFVGDPCQSIYRFRHADLSIFKDALKDIRLEGGMLLTLPDTFRLSPRLTTVVNRVFNTLFNEALEQKNPEFLPDQSSLPEYTSMNPFFKEEEGSVNLVVAPGSPHDIHSLRQAEAGWIARNILSLKLNSNELDQTALLFRSSAPMFLYKQALDKAGIPCTLSQAENLTAMPEIRDLIHILNGLSGDLSLITQTGILRSAFFHFSEMFIENYILQKPGKFLRHVMCDLFSTPDDKTKWELLTNLWNRWEVLKKLLLPSCLIREIATNLSQLENFYFSEDFFTPVEQWCQILEDIESNCLSQELITPLVYQSVSKTIRGIISHSHLLPSFPKISGQKGVHLMTMHSAKGLEFRRVYLPQLYASVRNESSDYLFDNKQGLILKDLKREGSGLKIQLEESALFVEIKNKEEGENRNEMKRLLYVAMTRASHALTLFLKEPSKTKTHLKDMSTPNEWLWFLMKEERQEAFLLFHEKEKDEHSIPWTPFEEKLNRAFGTRDGRKTEREIFPTESILNETHEKKIPLPFKPTYTASQIEAYFRCPKEFQLKYLCGIQAANKVSKADDSPPLLPRQWGELVHELLFHDDFSSATKLDLLVDLILMNKKIIDCDSVIKKSLLKLYESLLAYDEFASLLAPAKSLNKEVPFLFDEGPFYIRGTIDLVIQKEEGITLVDYKTDKISNLEELESRKADYFGQMGSYALVASRAFKRDFLKTALLFTDGPHLVMELWNPEKIKAFEQRLNQMHSHLVQKTAPFQWTSQPKTCFHCSYYELNYCGVRGL